MAQIYASNNAAARQFGWPLLEIADVGSLAFSPAESDSALWRPWWYSLGCSRGPSFDVADRISAALHHAARHNDPRLERRQSSLCGAGESQQ